MKNEEKKHYFTQLHNVHPVCEMDDKNRIKKKRFNRQIRSFLYIE